MPKAIQNDLSKAHHKDPTGKNIKSHSQVHVERLARYLHSTDTRKEPKNPCGLCHLTRHQGAKYWTFVNMVVTLGYLCFKLWDLLITMRGPNHPQDPYEELYLVYYCINHLPDAVFCVCMDFLTIMTYTVGSVFFAVAAFKKETEFEARLLFSKIYVVTTKIVAYIGIIFPKLMLITFRQKCPLYMSNAALLLMIIMFAVFLEGWCWYGILTARSFMYWVNIEEKRKSTEENAQALAQVLSNIRRKESVASSVTDYAPGSESDTLSVSHHDHDADTAQSASDRSSISKKIKINVDNTSYAKSKHGWRKTMADLQMVTNIK